MATSPVKKWLGFAVKAAVTAGLIWYVLHDQDVAQLAERLASVSAGGIVLAFLLLVIQNLLAGGRWIIVMRLFGDGLPLPMALRLYFEGLFFNQALPSTIGGDAVRMYRVVRAGLPLGAGINGVLLDRIAGMFALLLLVAVMQPWLYAIVEDAAVRTAFGAVILLGLAGVGALVVFDRLPPRLLRWPLTRGLAALSAGQRALLASGRLSIQVFGLSAVGHVLMVVSVYVVARDLGLRVGFLDCLALIPGVMLVAAAPVSIAGWGVREAVMVSALSLVGVPGDGAVGVSLLFGLMILVIGLIGGALWLANPDHRLDRIEALQEAAAAGEGPQPPADGTSRRGQPTG